MIAKKTPMFFPLSFSDYTDIAPAAAKTLVPAAWPSGISRLGAVAACDDCGVVAACEEWLKAAPDRVEAPPPFCPDASGRRWTKPVGRG